MLRLVNVAPVLDPVFKATVNAVPFVQFTVTAEFPVTAPELGLYGPKFKFVALTLHKLGTVAVTLNVVVAGGGAACATPAPASSNERDTTAVNDNLKFMGSPKR